MRQADSLERHVRDRYGEWPASIEDALERAALQEEGRARASLLRRERNLKVDSEIGWFEITEIEDPREAGRSVFLKLDSYGKLLLERTKMLSIAEALDMAWEMTAESADEGEPITFNLDTRLTKWFLSIISPDGMSYTGSISFSVDSFTTITPGKEVSFSLDYRGPDAHRSCLSVYGNTGNPAKALAEMLLITEMDGARRRVWGEDRPPDSNK
jgi:hypothetical protein